MSQLCQIEADSRASRVSPLFTVVIPVFNRTALLERALKSVLDQTCQDFEIVVVDDGSSDDPGVVIRALGDTRIRLIAQEHRGGNAARNAGIDHASGFFVALLDSDDQFLPHHLESMKALLQGRPNVVGYAPVRAVRSPQAHYLKPRRALASGEEMASYLLRDRGFIPTSTTALHTEIARRVRYDVRQKFAQDTDFAIRLWLTGLDFEMAEQAGAIWDDTGRHDRVSAGRKGPLLTEWLKELRPVISRKAYLGYRGWAVAKGLAASDSSKALRYYLAALFAGCYRPGLAVVIFAQIFFSDGLYRKAADQTLRWRNRWTAGRDGLALASPRHGRTLAQSYTNRRNPSGAGDNARNRAATEAA